MRTGEAAIYQSLARFRAVHQQLQWNRVQMFYAFNVVATPIVFSPTASAGVKLALCAMGFFIHFALFVASRRSERWIDFFETKMQELEKLNEEEIPTVRIPLFNDIDIEDMRAGGFTAKRLILSMGVSIMIAWLIATMYFLFH